MNKETEAFFSYPGKNTGIGLHLLEEDSDGDGSLDDSVE